MIWYLYLLPERARKRLMVRAYSKALGKTLRRSAERYPNIHRRNFVANALRARQEKAPPLDETGL